MKPAKRSHPIARDQARSLDRRSTEGEGGRPRLVGRLSIGMLRRYDQLERVDDK